MAGFNNLGAIADAELNGQSWYSTWRKAPTQATTAGVWFDLSMSPGNPVPQYYAASPLGAVALKYSTDGGLWHGSSSSSVTKYLRRTTVITTSATGIPMAMILCDYLLYYPFIDEGTTDEQTLTNAVSLPRYTSGEGVRIMAVSVAARTGGQTFRVGYTNSQGVSGRFTSTVIQNTAAANGHIVSTQNNNAGAAGPFLPLQAGDTGVRSIDTVQMISGTDVGLFTLVLVKPLATTQIRGIDAPVECDYLLTAGMKMPVIEPDAYLNWLCLPMGSLAATAFHGDLLITWN